MGQSYCKHVIVKYSESGHSGAGWYAHDDEYPEEGSTFFGHEPSQEEMRGYFCECGSATVAEEALLDALRSVDLQTLPEHLARLVAAWKAGT